MEGLKGVLGRVGQGLCRGAKSLESGGRDKGRDPYMSRSRVGHGITYMCRGSIVDVVYVALQEECHMGKGLVIADDVRQVRVCFATNVGKACRVGKCFWIS